MSLRLQPGTYTNLSAAGAITLSAANLIGFYVNSTGGGTLVLKDGGTGGTAMSGTITPAIGWHFFPACGTSSSGLYATIVGTINITFVSCGN
jgi:hypothetical protein